MADALDPPELDGSIRSESGLLTQGTAGSESLSSAIEAELADQVAQLKKVNRSLEAQNTRLRQDRRNDRKFGLVFESHVETFELPGMPIRPGTPVVPRGGGRLRSRARCWRSPATSPSFRAAVGNLS